MQGLLLKCRALCLHELGLRSIIQCWKALSQRDGWLLYLCVKPGQAFLHRFVVSLSAEMLHWISYRFILFWIFCYGNLGSFQLYLLYSFLDSSGSGILSLHMYNLLLVLLGIADVKHSMTFGNINKPLKALVQLDSLTCCPEVELSLSNKALYSLSGGGNNHCFSPHLRFAYFTGCFPGRSSRTGHPILELQGNFYALENEKERAS